MAYSLQYASTLLSTNPWITLTNLTLATGPASYLDSRTSSLQSGFYRARVMGLSDGVWIASGSFIMGSPTNEAERYPDETQHPLTLSRGFWMGKHLVTQGDYLAVTGANPSLFTAANGFVDDLSLPVDTVSWEDATNYCALRTLQERAASLLPPHYAYRLPTESEWEYAARAGTVTAFYLGNDLLSGQADFCGKEGYDAALGDIPDQLGTWLQSTTPVGSYAPNGWGLYDMIGNVFEWCQDVYGPYPTVHQTDPQGALSGTDCALRGGAWDTYAQDCRAARRGHLPPSARGHDCGFRVVLGPDQPPPRVLDASALPPQLGSRKILVMLLDFPDLPDSAPSAAVVSDAMLSVDSFYQSNSFNRLSLASKVIGPLRMPTNSAAYINYLNLTGLRNDALAAAQAVGCDPNNYDYDIVTYTNIGFSSADAGVIGGRGAWVENAAGAYLFDAGIAAHELGHNLGLGHAHAWLSPTVTGAGARLDYGNAFDVMGSGPFPSGHFNSNFKYLLGWIPTNCVQSVGTNGTYRIYAMDGGGEINPERAYCLFIPAGVTTPGQPEDYWVECRQLLDNPSLSDGVVIMWGDTVSSDDCLVLDTTPGSAAGILDSWDCPVTLGRSFTDPNKAITIAPLARGGTGPDTYFDVQVTLNSAAKPPVITAPPNSQSVTNGSDVVLSVSGNSSLPVDYQWRVYGRTIPGGTNASLVLTNVSAAQSGTYSVTLSNSLGSVESDLANLKVTYPPPSAAYPLPQGLVAWWPGDGHPMDWVGTNHGVLQGSAAYAPGEVHQAFSLNGSSDFIEVPNSPSWHLGTNDFSIELWANFSAVGGDRAFVADDDGGGQQNKWIFWLNDSQLRFYSLTANVSADNVGSAAFTPATNQWYHLAVTRIGDTFTFYINGAAVSTNMDSMNIPAPEAPLTIGAAEGAMFVGGLLDEIRIYQRGLSPAEILGIYSSGSTGMSWPANPPAYVEFSSTGTMVREGPGSAAVSLRRAGNLATTVSVNCLSSNGTALAQVNYLPVSSAIVFDPGESNKTVYVEILNDAIAAGAKEFTLGLWGVSGNAVIGGQSLATVSIADSGCLPPPAGLVAWWAADGSAADSVGTNDGYLINGASYAPGEVGQGFWLSSARACVSVPHSSLWAFGTNDFSIDLWASFSTVYDDEAFLASDEGGGRQPKWIFWLTGGVLEFQVISQQGGNIDSGAFSPELNQWYHFALTRTSSTFNLYVNGDLFYTETATITVPDALAPLTIGEAEGNFSFKGILDDVRLYDRALTGAEILSIYQAGSEGMCPP